jgi:hypothetical protein
MRSTEAPIDRAHLDALPVNQCQIEPFIFSDVAGLQSENMQKRGTEGSR